MAQVKTRTKTDIKTDINDQLIWDDRVLSTDVVVNVDDDGEVTLTGSVPTSMARRAAAEDAWGISGVKSVENKLTVEYPTTVTIPTDEDIKSNIDSSLLWNSSINSTKIDVSVNTGIVTLEGTVDAFWKKVLAENIASDVTGAVSVVNKLAVVPTKNFVDESIAEEITDSIDRKLDVSVDDVTVKVKEGNVTLSGTVPNVVAWSAAYDSALYTAGVKDINDEIEIS